MFSASGLSTFSPPRIAIIAFSKAGLVNPASRAMRPAAHLLSHKTNKNRSVDKYSSPRRWPSLSISFRTVMSSRLTCTLFAAPETSGILFISLSTSVLSSPTRTPALSSKLFPVPSVSSKTAFRTWTGSMYC